METLHFFVLLENSRMMLHLEAKAGTPTLKDLGLGAFELFPLFSNLCLSPCKADVLFAGF